MIRTGPLRARTNVALLFVTFGLGQGSILLAQTWLVWAGELAFIGRFGLSFTMATLAYYIIDYGGLVLLARQELSESGEQEANELFWNLTGVRAGLALVCIGGAIAYASLSGDTFGLCYAIGAGPGLALGAFNPAGILDGLRRSGQNGVATMFPALGSAVALTASVGLAPDQQGYVLGAAFSAGTIAALTFQYLALSGARRRLRPVRPSASGMWRATRLGGLILMTSLPTLFFYRVEVAAAMALLGPAQTGLFVYARQITGAALQAAQLIRRAEFPRLVSSLQGGFEFSAPFDAQKVSLAFGALASAGLAATALLAYLFLDLQFQAAALLAASFAPSLLAACLYATMMQAQVAMGRIGATAAVTNATVLVATALTVPAIFWLGLYAFPVIELGMNILAFLCLLILLRRPPLRSALSERASVRSCRGDSRHFDSGELVQ